MENTFFSIPAIYKRNYYLIKANQTQTVKNQNEQRMIYKQTAEVINQMISYVKSLFFKINVLRQQLQPLDSFQFLQLVDEKMEQFRLSAGKIPLTFSSHYPLDNKQLKEYTRMTGPFVMRLIKQVSYWRRYISFSPQVVAEIEQIFQGQKYKEFNLLELYLLTIRKIIICNHDNVTKMKEKHILKNTKLQEKNIIQQTKNLIPYFSQSQNGEIIKKFKVQLTFTMEACLENVYRGLDIDLNYTNRLFEEVASTQSFNSLTQQQKSRNKMFNRQIKQYRKTYNLYLEKRRQHIQKWKLKDQNRNIEYSLQKNVYKYSKLDNRPQVKDQNIFPSISVPKIVNKRSNSSEQKVESNKENIFKKQNDIHRVKFKSLIKRQRNGKLRL